MKGEKWFIWTWHKLTKKMLSWSLTVHLESPQNDTNLWILLNEWKLSLKLTTYSNMDWFPVPTCYSEFNDMNGKPHGQKIGIYRHIVSWEALILFTIIIQFSSVQSLNRVRLFVTPWIAARQASLSITNSRSSLRLTSIESVMPSNRLIFCHPLLLLPSIFPNIRVFSSESALLIRWPKY